MGHDRRDLRKARRGRRPRLGPARSARPSTPSPRRGCAPITRSGRWTRRGTSSAAASSSRSGRISMPEIIRGLIERGLADWSQIAFTTDDRSASRDARSSARPTTMCGSRSSSGLAPEIAIQCVDDQSGPPHAADAVGRLDRARPLCRYRAARRCGDAFDRRGLGRRQAGLEGKDYLGPLPKIDWPDWATKTVNIGRDLDADDFAIPPSRGAPP